MHFSEKSNYKRFSIVLSVRFYFLTKSYRRSFHLLCTEYTRSKAEETAPEYCDKSQMKSIQEAENTGGKTSWIFSERSTGLGICRLYKNRSGGAHFIRDIDRRSYIVPCCCCDQMAGFLPCICRHCLRGTCCDRSSWFLLFLQQKDWIKESVMI